MLWLHAAAKSSTNPFKGLLCGRYSCWKRPPLNRFSHDFNLWFLACIYGVI
uniref:Uncharacterized protein n=1 Tax=Aegilops tauschii subsp. strangulata TaxID=200361 RepID=A0A453CJD4_AEGTS